MPSLPVLDSTATLPASLSTVPTSAPSSASFLDTSVTFPQLDLTAINLTLADQTADRIVEWADRTFGSGLVMSTSFGIQAAVMLHLVTRINPTIPVVWIDTGYLPPETYRFADELTQRLQLNLKVYQSPLSPARMEALYGQLWKQKDVEALNSYDQIRK
ncbi:MAG: phosphoadenosine phosphosulfate reductase family protein, partial [Microcystaceae cyanobacterium]